MHLLSRLLAMTKNLVNIIADGDKEGKVPIKTLFEIRTELFSAEAIIQAEHSTLIERLFAPCEDGKLPLGVIKTNLMGDASIFYLN